MNAEVEAVQRKDSEKEHRWCITGMPAPPISYVVGPVASDAQQNSASYDYEPTIPPKTVCHTSNYTNCSRKAKSG